MSLPTGLVRALEKILREQTKLYRQYVDLLERERAAVVDLKAIEVAELSNKRKNLTRRLGELEVKRNQLVSEHAVLQSGRLSEIVSEHCNREQQARLLPLIETLKGLVHHARQEGGEFQQVVQHSLTMVNGALSIIWSATQNVVQGYGRNGAMTQAYQPAQGFVGAIKRA